MGDVERVYAWMDKGPVGGLVPRQIAEVDAPVTIMFQFTLAAHISASDAREVRPGDVV